jgi:ribose transport system ATP-binding protein
MNGTSPTPTSSPGVADGERLAPALEIAGLTKTFPGVVAVRDLDLTIERRTIHALIGQNGCGKSTIVKILAGFHQPDPGARGRVEGEELELGDPAAAQRAGVRFVHQDLAIVGELNALDNVALGLGFQRTRVGTIAWRRQRQETEEILERFGVRVPLGLPLAAATPVERTAVAIVRAMAGGLHGRGLLVLDEPTAALAHREVDALYTLVREVRDSGTAVLLISHRLDEVLAVADVVSVMRNGRLVGEGPVADMTIASMASMMTGTEQSDAGAAERASLAATDRPSVLRVRNVQGRHLRGVDVELAPGEIVGVAGVLGSGREELPYAIAGARPAEVTGEWTMGETTSEHMYVQTARALGIALVPAERVRESLIAEFSVRENLSLPMLPTMRRAGIVVDDRRERRFVRSWLDRMGVRANAVNQPITVLSGGNQQKVVLGRWLSTSPRVLLLSEPTAGVDIGARRALYELLREQAADGLAVLVASSDVQDLLELCDRVLVLRDGTITRSLSREELSEEGIIASMEGVA